MPGSSMTPFINGEFFTFARAGFSFSGDKLIALSSCEYDDGIEMEAIYGANMAPLGFGEGKYSANFKLTVSKEDFDAVILPALLKGGDGTVYGHAPFDFTVTYSKRGEKSNRSDTIKGIRIMKRSFKSAEGDKSTNVDIEGMALGGIFLDATGTNAKPVSVGGT